MKTRPHSPVPVSFFYDPIQQAIHGNAGAAKRLPRLQPALRKVRGRYVASRDVVVVTLEFNPHAYEVAQREKPA